MTMPMRHEQRGLVPELFDWLEIPFAALRPPVSQPIKFEDYVQDGRYMLRAELPGIDPEKDVEITVSNGVLTIRAEPHDEHKDQHRTEFTYGSFTRSVTLPASVDENDIRASYNNGILEVSVKLPDTKQEGKRIQIESPAQVQPEQQAQNCGAVTVAAGTAGLTDRTGSSGAWPRRRAPASDDGSILANVAHVFRAARPGRGQPWSPETRWALLPCPSAPVS